MNACRDHGRRRQTLKRFRAGLSVLANLAAPPDARYLYRRSWMASELARLDAPLPGVEVVADG